METAPLTVNSEEVGDAIKSFRPGSAPGRSGVRGEHLKKVGMQVDGRGAVALGALTRFQGYILCKILWLGGVGKKMVPGKKNEK